MNGIVKYCRLMVHALSYSGYSVNVEIMTIHISLLNLVSRYYIEIYRKCYKQLFD